MPARSAASTAPPSHPGTVLRSSVLPALGLSVSRAARELGVSRQTLHRLLAESIGISPEMAVRLGRLCGTGAEPWLRLQREYDLWHAERSLSPMVGQIPVHELPRQLERDLLGVTP